MGLGDFTKQEAKVVEDCIVEMYEAIPKSKRLEYIGNLNEALVFIAKAKAQAPNESEQKET